MDTLPPIAAACAVTAGAMYPVDVLRALKMASATGKGYTISQFIKIHGVKGMLSQGVAPEIARATVMRSIKIFLFPISHRILWNKQCQKAYFGKKGLAGALAVAPEVFTITSLELAKIGLQIDVDKKFQNNSKLLLQDIKMRGNGLKACVIGWQGVQARQMLWTGTYFATLSTFRNTAKSLIGHDKPLYISNFLGGFVAGALGAFVNTPADVIRTNIQKDGLLNLGTKDFNLNSSIFSFNKMVSIGKDIVKEKGIQGLYSGIGFKAMHMASSGAFVAMLIPIFFEFNGY